VLLGNSTAPVGPWRGGTWRGDFAGRGLLSINRNGGAFCCGDVVGLYVYCCLIAGCDPAVGEERERLEEGTGLIGLA
jgi:hypothetical protein